MSDLIKINGGKPVVNSLTISEEFGRQHKNVLQRLDKLNANGRFNGLDFKPVEYVDRKGERRRMIELSERGFLIAMPFIGGKKSEEGQVKLVDGFLRYHRQAERRATLEWKQARLEGKIIRRQETDTIKKFKEYAEAQGSRNAARYYVNITTMTYKALGMVQQGTSCQGIRDMLDSNRLSFLNNAEIVCAKALEDGMTMSVHYKEIYILARDRVNAFASTVVDITALTAA